MKFKIIGTAFVLMLLLVHRSAAQLPDSCKLNIGTNLGGISDYGTELPFVDLMHSSRVFYSQDSGNPNGGPFNTEATDSMTFRPDGYPTHSPQTVPGRQYPQKISTIWAITTGWPQGQYVVLYDGTGALEFWGGFTDLTQTSAHRIVFTLNNASNATIQMTIASSSIDDPIRNIRVLMPGSENTYETQPFNPTWLDKALTFKAFRFMDWGQTNNWGQTESWGWDSPELFDWEDRQQMNHYTWADHKGIPYEMMIRLMNDYDVDGWVCVPHRASDEYIHQMALLFRERLEPSRKLTVEYSNEVWNWIFGQAQWCFHYGQAATGLPWPECVVPYVQNCLDIWSEEYAGQLQRIERVVGVQAAWQDVSNRIVFNMEPGSFDAFSPACYFGLGETGDATLDELGASATVTDVAYWVRQTRETNEKVWLQMQKESIADSLHIPMIFYEGGQHITPTPFGVMPTYAQALIDIQRDTAIYNLYDEWFDFLRTLQEGDEPLRLMNFSFIGQRSAQYGSWGILENMYQDTSVIPAPKYRAILENMAGDCSTSVAVETPASNHSWVVFPNPAQDVLKVISGENKPGGRLRISNLLGQLMLEMPVHDSETTIAIGQLANGVYLLTAETPGGWITIKFVKQ